MKVGTGSPVLFRPTLLHLTSTCCVCGVLLSLLQMTAELVGGGGRRQDGCMGCWNLSGQKAWLR